MSVIRLDRISKADAENAVGMLWRILEEYDVASPKMVVAPRFDGFVDMCFAFNAAEDVKLVTYAWRYLAHQIDANTPPPLWGIRFETGV
jgi:hypothetical protein